MRGLLSRFGAAAFHSAIGGWGEPLGAGAHVPAMRGSLAARMAVIALAGGMALFCSCGKSDNQEPPKAKTEETVPVTQIPTAPEPPDAAPMTKAPAAAADEKKDPRNEKVEAFLEKELAQVSLFGVTLPAATDFLRAMVGEDLNVVIDPILAANGDISITVDLRNVSLRQALNLALRPIGIDYYVTDGALFITTFERVGTATLTARVAPPAIMVQTEDELLRNQKLEALLDQTITAIHLEGVPLQEAIGILNNSMGGDVPFVIDPAWTPPLDTEPIWLDIRDISLRRALFLVLMHRAADFAVWKGAIFISGVDRIQNLTPGMAYGRKKSPMDKWCEELLNTEFEEIALPDVALQEAIGELKKQIGQEINFVIDPFIAVGGHDIVISVDLKDLTLRQALTYMLLPYGLDFEVMDGAIFISTATRIGERVASVEIYSVEDLFRGRSASWAAFLARSLVDATGGDSCWPEGVTVNGESFVPGEELEEPSQIGRTLQTLLQSRQRVGWAKLTGDDGVLVVMQTPQMHVKVREFLQKMRAAIPAPTP